MADQPATEAHREFHFRDHRAPQQIQAHFENVLTTLFRPGFEDSKLVFRGAVKQAGCPYALALHFDAALQLLNCYTLEIHADWGKLPVQSHDYFRNSFESWVQYWTKPFSSSPAPEEGEGSAERYRQFAEPVMAVDDRLSTVAAVQRELLAQMRAGATLSTAHHEGGTVLRWQGSQFTRTDYGESDERQSFDDDAAFLAFVRSFYDGQTSSNVYPDKVPEVDAWKIILGQLSVARA
jgi:hypothetical protein